MVICFSFLFLPKAFHFLWINDINLLKVESVKFKVASMVGDAMTYEASSIEELRMRLAMQAGVLSPCILFFKGVCHTLVEDADDLATVFHGATPPYELSLINNEEGVKRGVGEWSSDEWIRVLNLHLRHGDDNIARHAESLISADEAFEEKMRRWIRKVIPHSYKRLDKHADGIKAIIALGMDINVADDVGTCGYTLLHGAARVNHIEILHALLQAGGNVNARNGDGSTPLSWAAEGGKVEAAQVLILAGADPSLAQNDGRAPIHCAAMYGHASVVSLLLDPGADINATTNRGWTPLHYAARRGSVPVVRILIEAGANANMRNDQGKTPFDLTNNEECRKALRGQ